MAQATFRVMSRLSTTKRPTATKQARLQGNRNRWFIHCAHGRFPLPAPATLAILGSRGVGITQCDEPHELVTPTGRWLISITDALADHIMNGGTA